MDVRRSWRRHLGFEADEGLPIMTMKVSGGNTVAAPGDYWYPRDEFVQLQLSGGSIPGEEIERVTFDATLKTLTVELKDQETCPRPWTLR